MGALSKQRGFTLLEAMIVVAIVGVLAAIAIPTFYNYIQQARVTESTTFLAEIKARQEAYRTEFGAYCDVSDTAANLHPDADPDADLRGFTDEDNWTSLGAAPDGPVRFSYATYAGAPADAPAELGFAMTDFWFVAHSEGDLDDDGTRLIVEMYSAGNNVWLGLATGAQASGGWE